MTDRPAPHRHDDDGIPRSAALDAAIWHIEQILGPREHPDCEAVIQVVANALRDQRWFIGHLIRCEAAAFRRGQMPNTRQQITYDGGLRRAAKLAVGSEP